MIVHNPTDTPVSDYPVQDPKTGDVHLWSITPGETLDFPDYVGSYLTEVYQFLQRVVTQEQLDAEDAEKKKLEKGRHFEPVKIVDAPEKGVTNKLVQEPELTKEDKLPENNPAALPATEMPAPADQETMGAVEGDEVDKVPVAKSVETPRSVEKKTKSNKVVCPECKKAFQNKAAAKTHYAHQHLNVPGL